MKLLKNITASLFTGFMLVSCVTINIYFPAAAAEKAADRIIEDIWGKEKTTEPKQNDNEQQQSQHDLGATQTYFIAALNWLVTPAAAEADLSISSPAIQKLQQTMKGRHNALKPFYDNGAIGLTEDGLLTMHDATVVSLKDRNRLKGLLVEENEDRLALYNEIARANNHPEWLSDIQATFARRWIDKAAKGWWYLDNGQWKQK